MRTVSSLVNRWTIFPTLAANERGALFRLPFIHADLLVPCSSNPAIDFFVTPNSLLSVKRTNRSKTSCLVLAMGIELSRFSAPLHGTRFRASVEHKKQKCHEATTGCR
jgi:hypothetical protein